MEVRPYGPTAWFADDVDDPIAWVAELRSRQVAGVIEIIPAEHTVVVVCERDRHGDIGSVVARIEGSPDSRRRRSAISRSRSSTTAPIS